MRFSIAPWTAGFIGAAVVLGLSVFYLVFVIVGATGDDDPGLPNTGNDEPTPPATSPVDEPPGEILYEGQAPRAFVLEDMRPAETGEEPDLRFTLSTGAGGEGLPVGYYVPVAAQWTAIDELTSDELTAVLSGQAANWSEVGGLDVPIVRYAVDGDPGASAITESLAPGATADETFLDYDALMQAMGPGSGAVAFIPLDRLDASVSAIGVDGIDIARGFGDTATWPYVERAQVEPLTDRGEQAAASIQTRGVTPPEVTRVVATGDYLPVRCSLARIEGGTGWDGLFATELGDYLRAADLLLSSQDGSIQDFAEPYGCTETVNLTSPPGAIDALLSIGVDGVTVAANHIFDCGQQGVCGSQAFERTLELLHEAGIKTAGGGLNLEEALQPAIFDVGDQRFGLVSFDDIAAGYHPAPLAAEPDSPGTAPMDDDYSNEFAWNPDAASFYAPAELLGVERLTETVRQAKEEVDFLVVMFNSGWEDTHDPSPRSIKGLRAAVDAGADLVIGNQAHHVQAAEVRDGVFVGYALGNFVYDQVHTVEHTQCYFAEASFWDDRLAATRLVPCQIENLHQPRLVDEATRLKILGDIYTAAALLPDDAPE